MIVQKGSIGLPLFDRYKYHIIVFLIALFLALTFSHPQLLVTDEWVTLNQISQMKQGHQVLINEGKYGVYENGTPVEYFKVKNNFLGYSLFLPILSFPALITVDILGSQFPYAILVLWTLIPIIIGMLIKCFMADPEILGKWRLSSVLFIVSFTLFFINLYYYIPFPISGKYSYPEVEAVVFTNVLCYAILAVLIYEILIKIFNDSEYALFGTTVCLCCSSYLIWTTCTKDHMLVAMLYGALLVSVVCFYKNHDRWFFPVSCLLTGLIAWVRPELALPAFIGTVVFYWFTYRSVIVPKNNFRDILFMIISPFFVLIGALPFFINNYFITKNPFIPPWTLWDTGNPQVTVSTVTKSSPLISESPLWIEKIIQFIISESSFHPDTFFHDLYGVLINPQNSSIGVFAITPLFLIALFFIIIIIFTEKHTFSKEEIFLILTMGLFSLLVLIAYFPRIYGMNTSIGVTPDIRYLSPAYLSLNIVGLIIFKKIPELSKNTGHLLKNMLVIGILLIPIVLVFIVHFYPFSEQKPWPFLFIPLNTAASIGVYILISIFLIMHILSVFFKKQTEDWKSLIISSILCIPFVWQVAATFLMRMWGTGLGGYSFWIPIVRLFYSLLFFKMEF